MRRLTQRLRRRLAAEEGFGLLELLMTLVILSTAIAGLLAIFMGSAFSLARAGHQGTATVIIDRTFEYYRRAPWADVRLVGHGPSNTGGVKDTNVTGDAVYNSTAQCNACPSGSSSAWVDEDAGANDHWGAPIGTANNGTVASPLACNSGLTNSDPDIDSTAPITNCLAITDVVGADGDTYRVYTYMKYGCVTEEYDNNHPYSVGDYVYIHATGDWYQSLTGANKGNAPATSPLYWSHITGGCAVDYSTKLVTIAVRLLNPDGTLQNSTRTGILAEQTISFSYQSYTTIA